MRGRVTAKAIGMAIVALDDAYWRQPGFPCYVWDLDRDPPAVGRRLRELAGEG